MTATSRSTRSARPVMSSRLPIGVATTNRVPGMKTWVLIVPLADRAGWKLDRLQPYFSVGVMPVSEPLPHFVEDLLAYLHETHPTYATLDGVHTHDDLLEDLSRHGIDSEAHALAGYLRRLDEINRDALTSVEKLEHRMLTAHLQARMFELEAVRPWERKD